MDFTNLGSTGLRVSVAGLGCGGSSRLGLAQGHSDRQAADIVRAAFDEGVNFFDTAQVYGTEPAVGLALAELPREKVVISTKSQIAKDGDLWSAAKVLANLDNSLRALGTDYVDVYHLHAVRPHHYEHALQLREGLLEAREAGKIRHIGITETAPFDHGHETLSQATLDPVWEVVMVAFHLLHQNARDLVFPHTSQNGIGTLLMFAVRAIFSRPERLQLAMRDLVEAGQLSAEFAQKSDPLDFLVHEYGAESLIDAAYRFVRHEAGVDVVLFGTGNPLHLKSNVESILRPPLPDTATKSLQKMFGHLVGVGLDLPSSR